MRFSKVFGATALFHVTLSAVVLNQGHFYNYAALSRRVEPAGGKGGHPSGGKGGDSSGADPNAGNPNAGNPNSGKDAGSSNAQGRVGSQELKEIIEAAQADDSTGENTVLADAEYQSRGQSALQKNEDAITANPMVDKQYNALENSYIVDSDDSVGVQPVNSYQDFPTVLGYVQLDPADGWTLVDALSKSQTNRYEPTFQGFVSNDQGNIIAMNSFSKWDTNTGDDRLPNSEIMYQLLMSKGENPSNLQNVIRMPISNKGSTQMMKKAVQAKFGGDAVLTQPRSFKSDDSDFDDLVGDYWTAINGLDNARPQSFMAADHPKALNGLKITEIIVWPQLPTVPNMGAMIVKMGR